MMMNRTIQVHGHSQSKRDLWRWNIVEHVNSFDHLDVRIVRSVNDVSTYVNNNKKKTIFELSFFLLFFRHLIIIVLGWIIVLVGFTRLIRKWFSSWLFFVLGRRNYRYFFQFLFLLCIHMIIIFAFCLSYILHDQHYQTIPESLLNDPYESLIAKNVLDLDTSTVAVASRRAFVGFSDYRFIVSIVLLVLLGLLAIPIFGLTGFHVFLVAKGRTTNEQVTGKFQQQGDIFTQGCCRNFSYLLCQPLYPQLKPPALPRYDVELFYKMAYENHRISSNGKKKHSKKKRKVHQNESEDKQTVSRIHVNPIEEKGTNTKNKTILTYLQFYF